MNFIGKFLNSHELGPNIQSGLLSRIAHAYTASTERLFSERCHKLANRTLRSCDRTANLPRRSSANSSSFDAWCGRTSRPHPIAIVHWWQRQKPRRRGSPRCATDLMAGVMTRPMRFDFTRSSTNLTSCRCTASVCSQKQLVRTQRGKLVATPFGKYAQQCVAGELTGDPVASCALAHGSRVFRPRAARLRRILALYCGRCRFRQATGSPARN